MNDPHDGPDVRHVHDGHDIGCLQAIELFHAYLDGELDPVSTAEIEHHLDHCRGCYSRAEFEGLLTARLRAVAAETAPEGLRTRLRRLMDEF
ncbi:MAG TPA: zf-HC2 domain-containing protein [Gemmatimonadota bacterium]|nr:zf-HC2 domain-containing protein [Gemmatimonadota bacterium]